MNPYTLDLLQALGIITGVLVAAIGFVVALWKTGQWFGAQTSEAQRTTSAVDRLSAEVTEGFRRNDTDHAELRTSVATIHDRIDAHAERLITLERREGTK